MSMGLVGHSRRWVSSAILLALACFSAVSHGQNIDSAPENIVVLGDSLSSAYGIDIKEGWVQLLQQKLNQQSYSYNVINAAITGDTTQGGLKRLPALLDNYAPELVIIELGGNDGLRGYSLTKLRENLTTMIELSRNKNAQVLLLGIRIPPNYGRRYSEGFFNSYANIATASNTVLVPVFMAGVDEDLDAMQADGIHPNARAQPQLLENVWPYLKPLLEASQ